MTRRLTAQQLAEYDEQGFTLVPNVFSPAELAAVDREIDRVIEARLTRSGGEVERHLAHGWVMSLGLASEITRNFCQDTRILDLVEAIVKPGIAIYSAKLVSKEPYDETPCLWHQDDAYYVKNSASKTRMSIWVPLYDVTVEQGCLQVIPGSHKRGLQPASTKSGGFCNLSMDVEVDLRERIYLPVPAGSMLLFSALLWHASDGNQTDRRRRAFIVSYQEATATAGNGQQWKILRPAEATATVETSSG